MTLEQKILLKIRYWQTVLNLTDWVVSFQPTTLKDIQKAVKGEAFAYITYRTYLKTAVIYLPTDIKAETLANLPVYDFLIVHEFLHLILDPIHQWYDKLKKSLGKTAIPITDLIFEEESETTINNLTKILVKMNMWLILKKEGQNEEGHQGTSQEEI